jgi:hypothetical protein
VGTLHGQTLKRFGLGGLYLVSMISYPGRSDFLIKFRLTTENTKSQC